MAQIADSAHGSRLHRGLKLSLRRRALSSFVRLQNGEKS
jgi:hypothetical protein